MLNYIKKHISILFFLVLVASCSESPHPITGNWVAVLVEENGKEMQVSPEEIRFDFLENGRYQFQSTLRYKEAGRYKVQGKFLIATDTTNSKATERVVAIEQLQSDSLVLRMLENQVERRLVFVSSDKELI